MLGWFERIRFPVLILGAIALAASLAWYLIVGTFDGPPRVLLVVGVLLVGIYVAIEPGEVAGALASRGTRYGANAVLLGVVFLAILGLLNFLSVRHSNRWDVTANRAFSLSDQTQKVLDGLPAPVHVTAFMAPGERNTEDVESLLRNYEVRSDGKLTWEVIDPDANPGATRDFGIRQINTLVFQMADKRQDVTGLTESDMTGALIKLAALSQPKVYVIQGHGERNPDSPAPDSYSEIKRAMAGDNYQVENLNLLTQGSVPQDAAVVILANPQNPLFPEELTALNSYLDSAGHLFLLVDPRSIGNVQDLVTRWGITLKDGLVVDPASSLPGDPRVPVILRYGFSPITQALIRDQVPIVLVEATAMDVPQPAPAGETVTPLAQTSGDRSYLKAAGGAGIDFVEGVDTRGPLTVAVAVEADAPNAPAPPDNPDAPGATRPKARAVIVGDSDFPTNQVLRLPVGNRDFFVNAVNWLTGSEELASIRPKPPEQRTLFLSMAQRNTVFFGTVILIPLLALVAGGFVWWGRR